MVRNIGDGRSPRMGPMHLAYNRSKRSLAIDLKKPEGHAAFLRLVRGADALIHNMRPQAVIGLKIAYDDLKPVKPDLVYCGAYGFSTEGPYAAKAAFDDIIQGISGVAGLTAMATGEARYAPTVVADKTTGLTVVYATLAALIHKMRTGEGQFVEVPMFETMVQFIMSEHLWGRSFVPPAGPAGYPRVMAAERKPQRTKDGWISILPYSTANWTDFFRCAGREDLIGDPRFVDIGARTRNIAALYAEMAKILATRTTAEWLAFCDAQSIPAAPVYQPGDLFDDPHLRAVGMFSEVEHPTEGRIQSIKVPTRFDGSPCVVEKQAPRIGAESREILREAGIAEAEVEALIRSGAVIQA